MSRREREIAALVAEGLANKEIATRLRRVHKALVDLASGRGYAEAAD